MQVFIHYLLTLGFFTFIKHTINSIFGMPFICGCTETKATDDEKKLKYVECGYTKDVEAFTNPEWFFFMLVFCSGSLGKLVVHPHRPLLKLLVHTRYTTPFSSNPSSHFSFNVTVSLIL